MMLSQISAEKARRAAEAERQSRAVEFERIKTRCQTLDGFIGEFWSILELKFGWALLAMCRHLTAVSEVLIQFKFQALWPLKLRDDQNAKGKFENTGNGFSEARPFSSMTGGRGDRVKIDDPHSTETAESDTERDTALRIFREGISDRLNDVTTSAIVIIMQRLHEQDIAAVATQLDIGFTHLNLPMEFEPDRKCITYVEGKAFFEDPRTIEGELLFPERFPPEEIERLKKAKGSYA